MSRNAEADVLIIGAGAAGLSLALRLADHGRIAVLAKGELTEGATLYAQGGVAAVLNDETDSFADHIEDTERAGADLCHDDTVNFVVRHGPSAIRWLIDNGVAFSCHVDPDGQTAYHLTREGGHSHRRVIHAADATGKAIEGTLESKVRSHRNIDLHEHHIAVDIITTARPGAAAGHPGENQCIGAYVLDKRSMKVRAFRARYVVLATGGAAKVYLYTSNPDTSTGDGIAMAWRAGCSVANMEFIQFHPTCLYHPQAKSFLITEAVRGEGGHLRLPNGHRFMQDHDERGELAPRDIVARAIDFEMKRHGLDHVNLDISHRSPAFIKEHFPTVYARCLEFGYDMTRQALPVVPAAHYTCGGVVTNLQARTDVEGLYAIGECAFTGLHGANRLASNSLLECLVFAESAANDIAPRLSTSSAPLPEVPAWDESRVSDPDEQVVVSHNWDELRRFMWDYVGIVRSTKRLRRAQRRIDLLKDEIREYYSNFKVTNDLIELRNLVVVAELIVRCALARKESRGLHYTLDFPLLDTAQPPRDTVLCPAPSDKVEVSQPAVTAAA